MSRRERMMVRFRELARERLARIGNDWLALETAPDDPARVEGLLREAHTLKGEARMLGFRAANDVVHAVEEVMHASLGEQRAPTPDESARVLSGLDLVGLLVQAPTEPEADLAAAAAAWLSGEAPTASPAADPPASRPPDRAESKASEAGAEAVAEQQTRAKAPTVPAPRRGGVRVSQQRLDQLAQLVNRVSRNEGRRREQLRGLRGDVKNLLTRLPREHARVLRGLDRELRRLVQDMAEDVLLLDDMVDGVESLRYRPIGEAFEAYPRAARDVAAQRGRQVRVVTRGDGVALDGEVLERIREPLLHLVRNAVDHGIEQPEDRRAKGKDPVGTVELIATSRSNTVQIQVCDDGGGLDLEAIRRSAVARGLLNEFETETLSPSDVQELIFRADFSSRASADDVSGRGVGLDVVRRSIEALGGSVTVGPRAQGPGTCFQLVVPVSTLVADMLLVRAGGQLVAIPVRDVAGLVELGPGDLVETPHGVAFTWQDQLRPMADLGLILDRPRTLPDDGLSVVVIEHDEAVGGLAVEALEEQRRAVVRPLDSLARGVGPIVGAVPLEEGALALVPDSRELLREITFRSRWRAGAGGEQARVLRIVVIDDSDFTRDMLAGLLREMGHQVIEAPNGRIGLDRVSESQPEVVFTDLDMPVLDGFGFLEALRERGDDVPVCVISTHREPEYVERASELGADGYLVKAEFDDERLARTLQRLVGGLP